MIKQLKLDGELFDYEESLDEEGYFYDISFMWSNFCHGLIITPDGVSVDWHSDLCGNLPESTASTHTNIVPRKLFGDKESLSEDELCQLLDTAYKIRFEGKVLTRADMEASYQKFLRETKGEI